jgi:hypothetical protein
MSAVGQTWKRLIDLAWSGLPPAAGDEPTSADSFILIA